MFEGKFYRIFVGTVATTALYIFIECLPQLFMCCPVQVSICKDAPKGEGKENVRKSKCKETPKQTNKQKKMINF